MSLFSSKWLNFAPFRKAWPCKRTSLTHWKSINIITVVKWCCVVRKLQLKWGKRRCKWWKWCKRRYSKEYSWMPTHFHPKCPPMEYSSCHRNCSRTYVWCFRIRRSGVARHWPRQRQNTRPCARGKVECGPRGTFGFFLEARTLLFPSFMALVWPCQQQDLGGAAVEKRTEPQIWSVQKVLWNETKFSSLRPLTHKIRKSN